MRQQAAASDVVIVNHHLLCADAAVRQSAFGEVIPACTHLVLDEAHQLEDVVTQYFGLSVSNYRIEDLARDAERLAASNAVTDRKAREQIARAVDRLREQSRAFFSEVAFGHRSADRVKNEERIRATDASLAGAREPGAELTGALDVFESTFALLGAPGSSNADDDDGIREAAAALARRAGELRTEVRFLLRAVGSRLRLLRRVPRQGHFSPRGADRRLEHRPRRAVRADADDRVDVGHADGGRPLRLRSRAARDSVGRRAAAARPSSISRRQAVLYLPPRMPDPRSQRVHDRRRPRSRRDPQAHRRPGVRPVHQLRRATRPCRRTPRWRSTFQSWCRGRRREASC